MVIQFTWQADEQEPLKLNTDMIQEDVFRHKMGLTCNKEEEMQINNNKGGINNDKTTSV